MAISSDFKGGALSGNIYLDRDVTLTSSITVVKDSTLNLNLNGHKITREYMTVIIVYGNLNVYDLTVNVDDGDITTYNNDNKLQGTISGIIGIENEGGIVKVFGGKIEGGNSGSINISKGGEVYLSGSPTIKSSKQGKDIVLESHNEKLYANDGEETPTYYTGSALALHFEKYTSESVAVYGVNDANKDKFTLFDTNYYLEKKEDTNNLYLMGKPHNVTRYDENGTELTDEKYPEILRYGDTVTIPVPEKQGYIGVGWLYSYDGLEWSREVWDNDYYWITQDMYFKACYTIAFNGGNGTENNPYQIANTEQLQSLAALVNVGNQEYSSKHYKLVANIDLSTICGENIGSFNPTGNEAYPFIGVFDGNHKKISNLYINEPELELLGLFGVIAGSAVIKNINLENVNIIGGAYIGAICGGVISGSIIGNTISGSIQGYADYSAIYGADTKDDEQIIIVEDNIITNCKVLQPLGYVTDGNSSMAYIEKKNYDKKDVIDVQGFYKGTWLKTTFANDGYEAVTNLKNVTSSAEFINNGRYIQLNYTVTAGDESVTEGKLAIHSDVMIGENDKAAIEVIQDEASKVIGLRMVDDNPDNRSYNSQFNLYFANTGGVTPVDTYWFGYYDDRDKNENYYKQLSKDNKSDKGEYVSNDDGLFTKYMNYDSGIAFSWQNIELEANESKTYSVILGVGEKSEPPKWVTNEEFKSPIVLSLDSSQANLSILVNAKITHVEGQTQNLYYSIDDGDGVDLGAFAFGEIEDSITKSLDISSLSTGDHSLNFWVVNSSGAASATVTKKITIDSDGKISSGLDITPPTNATVDTTKDTPPIEVEKNELIMGATTSEERKDSDITKIDVTLTVEKQEQPQDKHIVESVVPNNQVVGVYLDITLEKVIIKTTDGGESKDTASISEANNPITITVTIPEQLRDGSNYMIIRVHDGKAETLDATYDDEKHTLTFKTDKFSTYAITYTPKNMPPAQSSSSSSSSTSTKLTIENGRIYEGVVAVSSNQWVIVDQSNKLVKKLKPQNFTQQYDGQYKVYYVGDDGKLVTSWKLINDTWYYFNQDYTAKMNGWLAHYDDWYYFKNYLMVTSEWVATDHGRWYYLSNDGKMVRSQLVDGCWINSHGIYWGIAATEEDKLKYQ